MTGGKGVWGSAPFADVLVDLRAHPAVPLDGLGVWKRPGSGLEVEAKGLRAGPGVGALESAVLWMGDEDRTVVVVLDARGAATARTVVSEACPGLWRYRSVWSRGPENPHDDRGGRSEKRLWRAWEKKACDGSDVHAHALFAALCNPQSWLVGAPATWSARAGAAALVKWSPIAANAAEAHAWMAAGVRDPLEVVGWRWEGWGDDEDIREWVRAGVSGRVAAAYREAGLAAKDAGVWVRNAKDVPPHVAGALSAAGWSPTAARAVRVLMVSDDAVREPDTELMEWALMGRVDRSFVVVAVNAGLSANEVARRVKEGTLDLAAMQMLAALRQ